jgi:hypothetical protein
MRRETSKSRGRHLVAAEHIRKGQLIFTERPMIVMQYLETSTRKPWFVITAWRFVDDPNKHHKAQPTQFASLRLQLKIIPIN